VSEELSTDSGQNTTLAILERIALGSEPQSAAEIARHTGMHRASVYRNAEALVTSGWLRGGGTPRKYSANWKLISLGVMMLHNSHERDVAHRHACLLAASAKVPVQLSFYEAGASYWTDGIVLVEGVPVTISQGVRLPGISTSSGKVLLAFQDEVEIRRCVDLPQKRFTDRTITDPAEILRELEKVRAQGFATAWGEYTADVGGFSVPIFNRSGTAVAALGVNEEASESGLLKLAQTYAERASTELGYRISPAFG
jgi:DNA-binding IclR family transcriptional regulator